MVISLKMVSHDDPNSGSGNTNDYLKYCGGGFRKMKENVEDITIDDFINPWNFFYLFNQCGEVVINWCVKNGLIASELECPTCGGQMKFLLEGPRPPASPSDARPTGHIKWHPENSVSLKTLSSPFRTLWSL